MKKKILNVVKFIVFLGVGIFLFWLVYKDQDFNKIYDSLGDVNYSWILLSLFLGLLSHISRAYRWKMLANSLNYTPKSYNSFFSVMTGYLVNLAIPRLGEVSRAAVIKRYEKIPFTQTFGTIVLERIIDVLVLLILTLIVVLTNFDFILRFLQENPAVGEKFQNFSISNTSLIVVLGGLFFAVIMFFVFRNKLKETRVYKKIADLFTKFLEGIKSIRNIKNLPIFLFHTVFIWGMYFLMLYVCFFAIDSTSKLNMLAALIAFVMGSYGMVAPVQGGIGAYHFMIIGTLVVLGVANEDASFFALIAHGSQTLMLLVFGFLSIIALPLINKK